MPLDMIRPQSRHLSLFIIFGKLQRRKGEDQIERTHLSFASMLKVKALRLVVVDDTFCQSSSL